jgi:predicted membrane-bound spermidine synthase
MLELGIALSAALSPFLIDLARYYYIYVGGSQTLGLPLAIVFRLFLSAIILLVPTFLMGGTLPAVARIFETEEDQGRRNLALIYGINSLGGVVGVVVAAFVLLEAVGNRITLWSASLLNLTVCIVAYLLAGRLQGQGGGRTELVRKDILGAVSNLSGKDSLIPAPYIYTAAFVSGFSFLLMELVWYRMLTPILGGTTYTFALILAVALAGIGLGASLFSARPRQARTTLSAFSFVCGLQAFFMAMPYALGDRLALTAALLRPLGNFGFHIQIISWASITSLVVLLPAIMAGIQFPLLIGLLGKGRQNVGQHSGYVYGWNTAGAILGSLAGGFGLMPLLTAPGCWLMVVMLQIFLGGTAILFSWRYEGRRIFVSAAGGITLIAAAMLLQAEGPSAAWRYSAIGVGYHADLYRKGRNEIRDWVNQAKRILLWEAEGIESSVAINVLDGMTFLINGKPDGHVTGDTGTTAMGPLIGAVLHPLPRRAMVVGLGMGSSAGWLAQIDSMKSVDVVELEPAVLEVAKRCAPINHNVLENPKVRVVVGDGREVLQVGSGQYDLIFSEPSNPHNAGIASLYTQEFYQTVASRLAPGGFFSQWMQGYFIDTETIGIIFSTLASVFPDVEIWMTNDVDILFVCSSQPKNYSVPELRRRLVEEPFRSALSVAWGLEGLEGFLAGFVARPELVRMIAEQESRKGLINTDDRLLVEFGFARAAGSRGLFSIDDWRQRIREMNMHRPHISNGSVDWSTVDEHHFSMMLWVQKDVSPGHRISQEEQNRSAITDEFQKGNFGLVLDYWLDGQRKATTPLELAQFGVALADVGDEMAIDYAERLHADWPVDADAIMARFYWRVADYENALLALQKSFLGFRLNPWRVRGVMEHELNLATEMSMYKQFARPVFDLLSEPFSVYSLESLRKDALLGIASRLGEDLGAKVLSFSEPHVPWNEGYLRYRLWNYTKLDNPLAVKAAQDLQDYRYGLPRDLFNPSHNDD